jgi:hypothetical protein
VSANFLPAAKRQALEISKTIGARSAVVNSRQTSRIVPIDRRQGSRVDLAECFAGPLTNAGVIAVQQRLDLVSKLVLALNDENSHVRLTVLTALQPGNDKIELFSRW